jgi:methylmalonyl-CoA/ethylmalonyl-CoA epimerase
MWLWPILERAATGARSCSVVSATPVYRPMDILKDHDLVQTLHHLGFVVADVTAGMKGFVRSLAATWDGRVYEDPHQRVKVAFLSIRPGDPLIELVEPTAQDSPVRRFLTERGGGLHHVCYEVGDLEEQMAEMKARRCMIIRRPKPAIAFDGRRIAWMLTAENLLVELLEKGNQQLT